MNDKLKCTCDGRPICECGAYGIVKDGAGVRVAAHMMDSANGQLIVDGVTIDSATVEAYAGSQERAYDAMKHRTRYAHMGDSAPAFDDAAARRALADRVRHSQHCADNIERLNRTVSDPANYTADGRAIADLSPVEKAREGMIADMNAWRT